MPDSLNTLLVRILFLCSPEVSVRGGLLMLLFFATQVEAQHNEIVSLQLLWKHQFQFAGYYQAVERGYYRDEGIEVKLHEFSNHRDPVKAVLAGDVEFAVGRSSIVVDYAQGKPIKALFATFQRSPLMLMARDDTGIHSTADLKGKRIMITEDAQANAEVMAMLLQAGLRGDDFVRQDHSFNLNDLISGKTDVMGSYLSNEPYQMMQHGLGYTILHPGSMGFEMYSDILFTSDLLVQLKPELVERFRRASLKGWQYAFANIQATSQLIYEKYNTQQRSVEALVFEGEALKTLAYDNNRPLGDLTAERFRSMAAIYALLQKAPTARDLDNFIYRFDLSRSQPLFTRSERAYLNRLDKINYCLDPNWLPYAGIVNDAAVGIDSEYVRYVSNTLNKELRLFATTTWLESLKALENRQCDLLFSVMDTQERRERFMFSDPYRHVALALAVKRNAKPVSDFYQLSGKTIGLVEGDAYISYLGRHYPDIKIRTFSDTGEGLAAVTSETVFAMVAPYTTLVHLLRSFDGGELVISGPMKETWDLSIAVGGSKPELAGILDKVLMRLSDEDHLNFAARWVSVQPVAGSSGKLLWTGLSLLLLLLVLLLVYFVKISQVFSSGSHSEMQKNVAAKVLMQRPEAEILLSQLVREMTGNRACTLSLIVFAFDDARSDKELDVFLANLIPMHLSGGQRIGRWYDGKYIVILPDTDQSRAIVFARHLQVLVSESIEQLHGYLRCSFGVTSEAAPVDYGRIIQFADYALYEAVLAGGNCVVYRSARYSG